MESCKELVNVILTSIIHLPLSVFFPIHNYSVLLF
jgi:hypothetical protein